MNFQYLLVRRLIDWWIDWWLIDWLTVWTVSWLLYWMDQYFLNFLFLFCNYCFSNFSSDWWFFRIFILGKHRLRQSTSLDPKSHLEGEHSVWKSVGWAALPAGDWGLCFKTGSGDASGRGPDGNRGEGHQLEWWSKTARQLGASGLQQRWRVLPGRPTQRSGRTRVSVLRHECRKQGLSPIRYIDFSRKNSFDRLIGWLVDWLNDELIHWMIDWLIDLWLVYSAFIDKLWFIHSSNSIIFFDAVESIFSIT